MQILPATHSRILMYKVDKSDFGIIECLVTSLSGVQASLARN